TTLTYLHSDHLNTPRLATNQNGNLVWSWPSDAFGVGQPNNHGSTIDVILRFPGQVADAHSGLYYNYFRDYDPETGRYVESDPIGLDGGLNTYGYVEGNPLSSVDELGLITNTLIGIGVRAAAGEAAAVTVEAGLSRALGRTSGALVTCVLMGCADSESNVQSSGTAKTKAKATSVPWPERKRGKWVCICRANSDGKSAKNCPENDQDALGYGEGSTMKEAKNKAEKAAKDKLGAASTHHVQCRCLSPKGDQVIPTR
ncbi:RHS repeat-associated core domain-containing protein, partial [Metapseudomonas otitidis]|uniref:RHS repeat-associated core domain-containing protein n=1 Tax=Metapseudomonas otitidis TaxID=319939 RepID=UPI0024489D45